ncbi:platelet endothelial aggregation receptor 1-like [Drosophila hydei]|uniref:Platelet endothelial aggregation receptor 1-like n=1 Tax=Drosophila hydei TaxID=7224 RepID=A0A6J2SW23_DROHY|nr:platelet endothelial aggregation receptor 1-like [Drosophila hydei]
MYSSNYLALIILPTLSGLLLVTACTKTVYNSQNREQRILICCKGYKFSPNTANSYLCEPICISSCDNGFCRAPNVCGCHEGYENMRHDPTKSCVPVCSSGCKNGRCVAPNKCDCDAGYQPIEDGGYNICLPATADFYIAFIKRWKIEIIIVILALLALIGLIQFLRSRGMFCAEGKFIRYCQ